MNIRLIREIKVLTVREEETALPPILESSESVVAFFRSTVTASTWFDSMKECVVALCLNRKNRLIAWNLVSLGSVSSSVVHAREVFRPVIVAGATAVILIHNHPSGDPSPSAADIQITRTIREAGRVVGIDLIDHLIIGEPALDPTGQGFYSFHASGLI